jgi:hypothetical protein
MCTLCLPITQNELYLPLRQWVINFLSVLSPEKENAVGSLTKNFCEKKCTKTKVIFLKSSPLDEGFYRFDKTWLLFYLPYIHIEKAFVKSETALNYKNHKRTNLLRLFTKETKKSFELGTKRTYRS